MRTITGTVTENSQPVKGVSVFQEGSDEVAVTNTAGIYRVQVSGENPVIIYRHPDYPERKITLGTRITVNISFNKEKEIEEVVLNAGYYKVKDKERTGSIAKVSSKDIENQPVTNVLSAAQGRMSGVSITQNSGVPGGGFDIQIRGKNSIRREGNEPLYIIDGVPILSETPSLYSASILPYASINPLNSINPNDIESFEVLKDADATAIYGSRGANGVIIVTTKKGRKGRTDLKINTSYSLSTVANQLKLLNTDEYIKIRREAFQNDGITTIPAAAYDFNGVWDQTRNTDWQKELIGNTAEASVVQLSLSGGSENTSYLISYGHNEQTTVFPADFRYKTNNLTGNFSYRTPDKKLEVNLSNT
ncbi:TonB-dependent receptor plug domain-containing protein, partial [Chryseobacterium sp. CCH4-E10]|uniref:TonB-dependent receptor plug domain-containing protein n=1 Tax=Chryseobacterium sp. CCH4-E10 TaxID=1768758 RepID=UPI003977B7A9